MSKLRISLIAMLSSGWLLPLMWACYAFGDYINFTLIPQITGKGFQTAFPLLMLIRLLFVLSALWLAFAIVFWVFFVLRRVAALSTGRS
jgi:hypothetical protein